MPPSTAFLAYQERMLIGLRLRTNKSRETLLDPFQKIVQRACVELWYVFDKRYWKQYIFVFNKLCRSNTDVLWCMRISNNDLNFCDVCKYMLINVDVKNSGKLTRKVVLPLIIPHGRCLSACYIIFLCQFWLYGSSQRNQNTAEGSERCGL